MRLASFILVALAALVYGCSSTLTGPPTVSGGSLSSYFWPDSDSTYSYVTDVDGHTHHIVVKKGGSIVDSDISASSAVALSATAGGGKTFLSGFSSSDIFSLDPTIAVVMDTNPKPTAPILSISTMGNSVYVATATTLYAYVSSQDTLQPIGAGGSLLALPTGVTNPRLFEDAYKHNLYCIQVGGSAVYSIKSPSYVWQQQGGVAAVIPGGGVTLVAAGDPNDQHSQFWVAAGSVLWRFDQGSYQKAWTFGAKITAMEHVSGGPGNDALLVGLDDGSLFSIDQGSPNPNPLPGFAGAKITAIADGFIGTDQGLFDNNPGSRTRLTQTGVTALYWTWSGSPTLYIAQSDNTITSLPFSTGQITQLGTAIPFAATQFATDYLGRPYALVNAKMYGYRSGNWQKKAERSSRSHWTPGGLTLLQDGVSSWNAGKVENFAAYNDRGFTDSAIVVIPSSTVQLDGVKYDNTIAVRYTAWANGVSDNTTMPEYTIFYQYGTGPVRIEKVEGGVKHITRFVY